MNEDVYEDDASPAAKYEAKQLFQEAYQAQLAENFPRLAEKMSILGVREICIYEKHKRQTRVPADL